MATVTSKFDWENALRELFDDNSTWSCSNSQCNSFILSQRGSSFLLFIAGQKWRGKTELLKVFWIVIFSKLHKNTVIPMLCQIFLSDSSFHSPEVTCNVSSRTIAKMLHFHNLDPSSQHIWRVNLLATLRSRGRQGRESYWIALWECFGEEPVWSAKQKDFRIILYGND